MDTFGDPLKEIHNIFMATVFRALAGACTDTPQVSDKSPLPQSLGNIFSWDVIRLPYGEGLEGKD